MNFEQEVRTLARRCIMEEINNLGYLRFDIDNWPAEMFE